MRKVKCNKRQGACFLQQPKASHHILVGRGGLVQVGKDYVIPISSLGHGRGGGRVKKKQLEGGGRRRKKARKTKKRISSKKLFTLAGAGKRKKKRKKTA